MEYSPGNNIPYISRVDAGTVEAVRQLGIDVASSGDLVQRFEAIWSDEALQTHRAASERLYRIKDRAFELRSRQPRAPAAPLTELDVQRAMVGWFEDEGLITDSPPVVAAQENAGDPHYGPSEKKHRAIGDGEVVLLDLWGKLPQPGAVYADITWVGFTAERSRTDTCRRSPPRATAATRPSRWCRTRCGRAASCADSKSTAPAGRCSRRRASAPSSCTAPATASAPKCTATACTWTTSRPTTSAG